MGLDLNSHPPPAPYSYPYGVPKRLGLLVNSKRSFYQPNGLLWGIQFLFTPPPSLHKRAPKWARVTVIGLLAAVHRSRQGMWAR